MAEFLMPSLGADMDEGTLVEWLVKVGDVVHRGDIVAVVDTTKSAIEVEVFADGVVEQLLVEPGTTVPVGTPLAVLAEEAGAPSEEPPSPPPSPMILEKRWSGKAESHHFSKIIAGEGGAAGEGAAGEAAGEAVEAGEPAVASPIVRHLAHERGIDLRGISGTGPGGVITRDDLARATQPQPPQRGGRVHASPLARRRASDLGVDLATVPGSGAGGAVTAADVERAAEGGAQEQPAQAQQREPQATPASPSAAELAQQRAAAMRQTIANLMARSKKEIPHYYLRTTVDLSSAAAFVRQHNAGVGVAERILPAVLLLKAAACAVRSVPEMNGFFVDGSFERSEHVHLGVAVSLRGGGLVAPAIHDADTLSLPDLMAALKDLVARTRSGRLRGSQMSDPTMTVTNLGEQGVEVVHGVIYPPQVALVGFGTIVQRPWAVDGMLTVRPLVTATLAADHRVSDGHRGALYLSAVDALLQRPEEL